jgi:hypothetical protein
MRTVCGLDVHKDSVFLCILDVVRKLCEGVTDPEELIKEIHSRFAQHGRILTGESPERTQTAGSA